jgi:hypothetical protein
MEARHLTVLNACVNIGADCFRYAELNEAALWQTLSRVAEQRLRSSELACVAEEEISVTHLRQIMLDELRRRSPLSAPTVTFGKFYRILIAPTFNRSVAARASQWRPAL